jgi:hypothetical protein
MTKMELKDMEKMCLSGEAFVTHITAPAGKGDSEISRHMIEALRQYHQSIGDEFIGHDCGCTPGGVTIWHMCYKKESEDRITKETDAIFESVIPAAICSIVDGMDDETRYVAQAAAPCVCPFSLR